MREPIVGPLNPVTARNALAGLCSRGEADPEVENAARTQLATAKIDKAIREALAACPVPLHHAQVEYLTGLISNGGSK